MLREPAGASAERQVARFGSRVSGWLAGLLVLLILTTWLPEDSAVLISSDGANTVSGALARTGRGPER